MIDGVQIASAVLLLLLGGVIYWFVAKARRKQRLLEAADAPFPDEWHQLLGARFPLYRRIPLEVRGPLQRQIQAFLADKNFEPCGGLEEITDEMKLLVAVQACLLVWDDERMPPFPELRSILYYPRAFRRAESRIQPDYGGDDIVEDESENTVTLGESWNSGSVILSWESVQRGGHDPRDGLNVVIHEFAHQLDQEAGAADGLPYLKTREEHREWAAAFTDAWEKFNHRVERYEDLVIDSYGATNPAEFFAVASETFFEKAKQLRDRYPEVYEQLSRFYRLDPAEWRSVVE